MSFSKLNRLIYIFYFLFALQSSIFCQNNFIFKELEEIKKISITYEELDFQHPQLILNKTNDAQRQIKKINFEKGLVKFTPLNKIVLTDKWIRDFKKKGRDFKKITKFLSDIKVVDSTIICLFSERYKDLKVGRFDLLIFEIKSNGIFIKGIYPESFGSSFFIIPQIFHVNGDTIKFGSTSRDEGSINGWYKYLVFKNETIIYYRKEVIQGHCSFFDSSNPIKGATTKRYHNEYFSQKGETTKTPIYYTSVDESGNTIFGQVVTDSLSLYELYWAGIGNLLKKVKPKEKVLKVGEISYRYHDPFIAIKFEKKWYWVPADEIKL